MEIREATPDDGDDIRAIARRSLEASYSLSPKTIEGAVEKWYDDDDLAEKFEDDDLLVLVAVDRSEIVGFAEVALLPDREEADLLWLHVAPEHRGQGAGDALFDATRTQLDDRDIDSLRGRVLADNAEGNDFYATHGFEKAGETEVEIDGSSYVENVYVEETAEMAPLTTPEGEELFVDRNDTDRGSKDAMAVVYSDPDSEQRYGYLCLNCESLVTTMDTMGRMECESCGNHRKPTRWDAAYM